MRLSHNLSSLKAYQSYQKSLKTQSTALNNISTGNKINKAGDHPNKMAQSERFNMQIKALNMASRNAQDGVSMLQAAESSMESITSQLQRARELIVQAGGTGSEEDLVAINAELKQIAEGIDNAAKFNDFNGVNIIAQKGETKPLKMPVGSDIGEEIEIPTYDFTAEGLGLMKDGNLTFEGGKIDESLGILDSAIDKVVDGRSKCGAICNTFESKYEALNEISTRIEGADSVISGADIAYEAMEYTRSSILVDAGIAIIHQSNRMPQDALRILENVRSR